MSTHLSYLDVAKRCDNFRPQDSSEPLTPFRLSPSTNPPIGLLLPPVVAALVADNVVHRAQNLPESWLIHTPASTSSERSYVAFAPHLTDHAARSAALATLCSSWRDAGVFVEKLGANLWRDELYDVYWDPFKRHGKSLEPTDTGAERTSDANLAFSLERAACVLFGVITCGVNMTVFEQDENSIRVWVPRRAKGKPTFPGMLDNSVGGGIAAGTSVHETLVKEAMEEASLPADAIHKYARSTGALSYFYRMDTGHLQPEIAYVYDMHVPVGKYTLKPMDGEVESFELLPLKEVIAHLRAGEFKPNCGLVLLDFLIRKGYVTPDDEPDFMEIITRLHGRFDIDKW
ncbi:hypothetical protein DENSPDRAFT_839153 [Dentipellis sp. KUC8613]|nr:hypothetical protein DENSPDRAFT_839153 [Dentipellis sp. KUC8613]